MAVQKLRPTIDAIKRQYGEDKDKIQRETSALYEKAGVNPLAGTLLSKFEGFPFSIIAFHEPCWRHTSDLLPSLRIYQED